MKRCQPSGGPKAKAVTARPPPAPAPPRPRPRLRVEQCAGRGRGTTLGTHALGNRGDTCAPALPNAATEGAALPAHRRSWRTCCAAAAQMSAQQGRPAACCTAATCCLRSGRGQGTESWVRRRTRAAGGRERQGLQLPRLATACMASCHAAGAARQPAGGRPARRRRATSKCRHSQGTVWPSRRPPEVRTARWLSLSGCHPICSTRRPGRLANSSPSSTAASHTSCTACTPRAPAAAPPPGAEPGAGLAGAGGAGRQLVRSTTTTRLISGSSRALPATAAYVPERFSAKCAAVSSNGGDAVSVRRRSGGAPSALAPPCGAGKGGAV